MTFDYKNYSLENFKNWLHDCLGTAEATPEEIYTAIKEVVTEEHQYYQNGASKTQKLLDLLQGNDSHYINSPFCDYTNHEYWDTFSLTYDSNPLETKTSDFELDGVNKWVMTLEEDDSTTCAMKLPEDMRKALSIRDNDKVEITNNHDGSITIKKAN